MENKNDSPRTDARRMQHRFNSLKLEVLLDDFEKLGKKLAEAQKKWKVEHWALGKALEKQDQLSQQLAEAKKSNTCIKCSQEIGATGSTKEVTKAELFGTNILGKYTFANCVSEQGKDGILWTLFEGHPFCSRRVASFATQDDARYFIQLTQQLTTANATIETRMLESKMIEHILDGEEGWQDAIKERPQCPTMQSAISLRICATSLANGNMELQQKLATAIAERDDALSAARMVFEMGKRETERLQLHNQSLTTLCAELVEALKQYEQGNLHSGKEEWIEAAAHFEKAQTLASKLLPRATELLKKKE